MIRATWLALCLGLGLGLSPAGPAGPAAAADPFVIVQSTTSTQNSGLYGAILPVFEKATGIDVRVVAVGTGQALKNASLCDGDLTITHARAAEEAFVEAGFGLARHDLMRNDFVLVGPAADPAGIAAAPDPLQALTLIAEKAAPFASRGDDSGTHKAELALWGATQADPSAASGGWYLETGTGMGATLNLAVAKGAYTLTDRATWLAFGNKGGHVILLEGGEALNNQYGLIVVDPSRCAGARAPDAQTLADWLLGPGGQAAIAAYRIDGQQAFFPNAAP